MQPTIRAMTEEISLCLENIVEFCGSHNELANVQQRQPEVGTI